VIVPTTGEVGACDCLLITTFADVTEIQPAALATVKANVPAARPDMIVLVPVPVDVITPGVWVKVHIPTEGNPFSTTLPVATSHVGWVMVPTVGALTTSFTVRVKLAFAAEQ
jgi:hypothetical protein